MKATGVLLASGAIACLTTVVPGAAAAPSPQVITLLSTQTSLNDKVDGKVVIHDRDFSGKKQVGQDILTCLVKTPKVLDCVIVITLAKGTVSAKFNTSAPSPAPTGKGQVSGGSGAYKGAHGSFAYKNLNKAGTRTQLTLTIQ